MNNRAFIVTLTEAQVERLSARIAGINEGLRADRDPPQLPPLTLASYLQGVVDEDAEPSMSERELLAALSDQHVER